MQSTDGKRNRKRIIIIAAFSVFLAFTLLVSFGEPLGIPTWQEVYSAFGVGADLGDDLSLSFLNIGSADSCYITCHGKNILIDSGYATDFDRVSAYINRNGCKHFDALIISHPDSDHMGGFSQIIENYGADKIYMHTLSEELMPDNAEYKALLNSIEENNVELVEVQSDINIKIGDLSLQFITPVKDYDSRNDNSLLVKITYGKNTFLFSGDISQTAEADYVNSDLELKSDVLKVPHHGAKTSATEEFLCAVQPKIAVVSTAGEKDGNASYETMQRIAELCEDVYRTDNDNTVVITSDGENIRVQTNA